MTTEVEGVTDAEIAALMAELEEESAVISTPPPPKPLSAATTAALEEAAELARMKVEMLAKKAAKVAATPPALPPVVAPEPAVVPAVVTKSEEKVTAVKKPAVAPAPAPDANCVTEGDGSCVGGTMAGKEPCMHDAPSPVSQEQASQLQFYIDVDKFRVDTRVTDVNLDQCMIEQNGHRAFYGAQAARAEAQASRLKARFEVIEATLFDRHRKALALIGEKTTEKMIDGAVKLDPLWLKAKNLVIEGETVASINKAMVESLKDRRDMIIQLGADRRDEYKGQARTMAERDQREELSNRARNSAKQAA
jgi:hypothetical protein